MSLFRPASAQTTVQARVYCDRCQRWFINDRALEQHTNASYRHNVCAGCDFDYITRDEMEECDCNASEDDDEYVSDEYGSAGTLSDDGGGAQDAGSYGFVLGDRFNTYYTVPGAWRGGTSTSASEASMPSYGPYYNDEFYSADTYAYESEEYGTPSEASYSHSEDVTEEDEDEEDEVPQRDRGQSPVQDASESPYCQRCNRVFNTVHGMHMHNRMSSMHPWYCSSCRIDHDREEDFQRHNSIVHASGPRPTGRQQSTTITTNTRSRAAITILDNLSSQLRGILDRSGPAEADTSTSTIQPATVNVPVPPPPPPILTERIPPVGEVTSTGTTGNASASLVVTCPLCLGETVALTSTLCGHVFCKECITAAIRRKPECPVCRAFTHIRSLHPIFLNIITS